MRLRLKKPDRATARRQAREALAGRRVRLTHERELVLDGVMAMAGHFGAEDLVFALRQGGRRVSRATVYRTLDLLVDAGLLQRLSVDEGGWQYEVMHGRAAHAHLYCVKCGKLVDYPVAGLEELHARVQRETKFKPQHHVLRICGICDACQ
jgi:Fur family ferric uptake transcriptional regulator